MDIGDNFSVIFRAIFDTNTFRFRPKLVFALSIFLVQNISIFVLK